MAGYLLGFDVGSSSIKASLVDIDTGAAVASATSPDTELEMIAAQIGWAEQHPDLWWEHMGNAVAALRSEHDAAVDAVSAIGISYQMHGLVLIDKNGAVVRPSIIWCDSRAVPYGDAAFDALGEELCLTRLLNSPGNFTAAKLAWVKENEPEVYDRSAKMLLPGDYLNLRLTGELNTTPSALSEAVLWDSQNERLAQFVLDHFGFDADMIPPLTSSFSVQGRVTGLAAAELGLPEGIPVAYRAGDQPNNALSLNVLKPGEIASTAGTSGVVYGVAGSAVYDRDSRVNTFVHVNHEPANPRYGVLLCLNGTGICNRWFKQNTVDVPGHEVAYAQVNEIAGAAPVGAHGVQVFPFGNGAERTLKNKDIGASVAGLNFNVHDRSHLLRAAQEGIAFGLAAGLEIMRDMGMEISVVKAGEANMFQSELFRTTFASVADAQIQLYDTDGSVGAARGAGLGAGIYASSDEAFSALIPVLEVNPDAGNASAYNDAFSAWKLGLANLLSTESG